MRTRSTSAAGGPAPAAADPAADAPGPPAAPPVATPPAAAPFTELSARRLGPVRRYFVRHPVAMDVVVMLVFFLPTFLGLVFAGPRPAPAPPTWTYLLVVALGTAALARRRQAPLVTTAAMVALFGVAVLVTGETLGFEIGIAFGMYAVAASRPVWLSWSVLAGTVAASYLLVAVSSIETVQVQGSDGENVELDERTSAYVAIAICLLVALAIGISVRNRRLHVTDLVERANALARDRDQQAQLARAAERSRIAREMHDVVAHSLSVMIALADGAGVAFERSPERARAALDELSATGRTALADMRRVLGVLDTAGTDTDTGAVPLAPQPGSNIEELVDRFRTAGLPVRAVLDRPLPEDANLQLTVYRITQEALTNALRHAPGTTGVQLTVRRRPGAVEVEVVDEGTARVVPPSPGTGRGLIGMRERAAVYGGTVEAGRAAGGWRVHARIPWPPEES